MVGGNKAREGIFYHLKKTKRQNILVTTKVDFDKEVRKQKLIV